MEVDALRCLRNFCAAICIAAFVLDRAGYAGPVRIAQRLSVKLPFYVVDSWRDGDSYRFQKMPTDPGEYNYIFPELSTLEMADSPGLVVSDFLHWLYQVNQDPGCHWFDSAGVLKASVKKVLPRPVRDWFA